MYLTIGLDKAAGYKLNASEKKLNVSRVFPKPFTHEWGGGQVQGDKVLIGGLMKGSIDLMGGPNFDRLYHKLKALLLLSCNYMMQFIGYDCIQTRRFISYGF